MNATPAPRDRVSVLGSLVEVAERFVTNRDHAVTRDELAELRGELTRVAVRHDGPLVVTVLEGLLLTVLEQVHGHGRNGDWLTGHVRRRLLSLAGELLPDARAAFGRALDARDHGYRQ